MMKNDYSKRDLILERASEILRAEGNAALSMRRVAVNAEMRLSNVQYYFKNKHILLSALADRYFTECLTLLERYDVEASGNTSAAQLRNLIEFLVDQVEELSDMCRMFRELWAISSRDTLINDLLIDYYKNFGTLLAEILTKISGNTEVAKRQVSILIPFIEGYSIVSKAMPLDKREISESLFQLLGLVQKNQVER